MSCRLLVFALVCWAAAGALAQQAKPARDPQERRTVTDTAQQDPRLRTPRTLDDPVPPPRFESAEEWLARREALRRQVLISLGLWPPPRRAPLKPRIFGRVERDGYSIEKVYFESLPGFYVTGNLYRPLPSRGRVPGVLATHGHWGKGRMANEELGSIPGRCISLARQGMVAFSYDMIGYNDSLQLPHNAGYGNTPAGAPVIWGPREALWGLSLAGLQTWNSIRALDFLETLPDVDPKRLAVTGESGGGTQTFLLTAVDDRPAVSCPVNMISLHMQGGCLCENAPGLRVGTSNVEIGALMAPKPMLMVSATGDWTKDTPKLEYPATLAVYRLLGAAERVENVHIDAPHNNNRASREAMYTFFRRWLLGIPDGQSVTEPPFTMEPEQELRVFPDGHLPKGARTGEEVVRGYLEEARRRAESLTRPSRLRRPERRRELREALAACLKVELPAPTRGAGSGAARASEARPVGVDSFVLSRPDGSGQVTVTLLTPSGKARPWPLALGVSDRGRGAFVKNGRPAGAARELLQHGYAVMAADLFLTGDSAEEARAKGIKRDHQDRFFTTYNVTDTGERVRDLLTCLEYARSRDDLRLAALVAEGKAGLWALLARALAPDPPPVAANVDGFASEEDEAYLRDLYVPSLRLLGDFAAAAALAGSSPLLIHNTQGRFGVERVEAAHRAGGKAPFRAEAKRLTDREVLSWLGEQR